MAACPDLRIADGSLAWTAEQAVPRLTLRGTAQPVLVGDMVLSGFDNGRVMALSVADGSDDLGNDCCTASWKNRTGSPGRYRFPGEGRR